MDSKTIYYKRLCEKTQKKINVLKNYLYEAGLKTAMRSGDPDLLRREYLKQNVRKASKEKLAGRKNLRADQLLRANPLKAGSFASSAEADMESARQLGANIEEIGMQLGTEYPDVYQRTRNSGMSLRRDSGSYQY